MAWGILTRNLMTIEPSPSSLKLTVQELQCEFCEQPMFPPIFQCTHGHSVCPECNKIASGRCPGCMEKLRTIRHPVWCRFKSLGCEHIIPYKYIDKHEYKECKYRLYACPFFSNHYCPFTGDIPQVFTHLKDDHMVDVYDASSFKINYRQLNLPRHTLEPILLAFRVVPEECKQECASGHCSVYGRDRRGVQFRYSVEIKGSRRKLVSSSICGSLRYSAEIEFPRAGAGLIFASNTSRFILEGDHNLEIKGYISDM